jgi:hypothetical protein
MTTISPVLDRERILADQDERPTPTDSLKEISRHHGHPQIRRYVENTDRLHFTSCRRR